MCKNSTGQFGCWSFWTSFNYKCRYQFVVIATSLSFFLSVADCVGEIYDLCILQYSFKFGEHDVKICRHGNSQYKSDSYIRTQPSTLQQIKEKQAATTSTPKHIIAEITEEQGGIVKCRSASSLRLWILYFGIWSNVQLWQVFSYSNCV